MLPLVLNKIRDKGFKHPTKMPGSFTKEARIDKNSGKWRPHNGWDLDADANTAVLAVGTGKIVATGDMGKKDWGKYIQQEIKNPKYKPDAKTSSTESFEYLYVVYAHLSRILVKESDKSVEEGTEIARSGTTGNAAGESPHLHIEILTNKNLKKGASGRLDPGEILGYEIYSCGERPLVNQAAFGSCKK